jgi:hypothetical protein
MNFFVMSSTLSDPMKAYLFLFCCLGLLCGCFRGRKTGGEDESSQNIGQCPYCLFPLRRTESKQPVLMADPSSEPARDENGDIRQNWRFLADFDGDGLEDMAVSEACSFFGSGGGSFGLYLQETNGLYRGAGGFSAYAGADSIVIEHLKNAGGPDGRLWTRSRNGGVGSIVTCQDIEHKKLSWGRRLELYYGGTGEDISDCIEGSVFGHSSPIPVRLEWGGYTNGAVVWHLYESSMPKEEERPSESETK